MARTSAARKPRKPQKEDKEKKETSVKYKCITCGRVVYLDISGDYFEDEDLICCGELMIERED